MRPSHLVCGWGSFVQGGRRRKDYWGDREGLPLVQSCEAHVFHLAHVENLIHSALPI